MEAENLVLDDGGEGKIIEEICESSPNIGGTVLSHTLVVETVNLGNDRPILFALQLCGTYR